VVETTTYAMYLPGKVTLWRCVAVVWFTQLQNGLDGHKIQCCEMLHSLKLDWFFMEAAPWYVVLNVSPVIYRTSIEVEEFFRQFGLCPLPGIELLSSASWNITSRCKYAPTSD
jgi:hypothetical protein